MAKKKSLSAFDLRIKELNEQVAKERKAREAFMLEMSKTVVKRIIEEQGIDSKEALEKWYDDAVAALSKQDDQTNVPTVEDEVVATDEWGEIEKNDGGYPVFLNREGRAE